MIKIFNRKRDENCCEKYNDRQVFVRVIFTTFGFLRHRATEVVPIWVIFTTFAGKPLAFRGEV